MQTSSNVQKFVAGTLAKHVYQSTTFHRVLEGPIGTHSLRKFATTFAIRNGCSREEVDRRGRWRRQKQSNDVYIDLNLAHSDAKVARKICVGGGPCKYKIVPGLTSVITEELLLREIVPTTASIFHRQVALTLALPLLWAVFDPEVSTLLPMFLTRRVHQALPTTSENPVQKIPLMISGHDAVLRIDELITSSSSQQVGRNPDDANLMQVEHFDILNSKIDDLDHKCDDIKGFQSSRSAVIENHLVSMNTYLRRNAMFAPFRRTAIIERNLGNVEGATYESPLHVSVNRRTANGAPPPYETTLSHCPKDLYTLWLEYETGIGGRKPAREFTSSERGRVKFTYCKRKLIWDRIEYLLARCHVDSNDAIKAIYRKYGENCTVSQIIKKIGDEKKAGRSTEQFYPRQYLLLHDVRISSGYLVFN